MLLYINSRNYYLNYVHYEDFLLTARKWGKYCDIVFPPSLEMAHCILLFFGATGHAHQVYIYLRVVHSLYSSKILSNERLLLFRTYEILSKKVAVRGTLEPNESK